MSYVSYHVHSMYSLLDSCTKFDEYIQLALRDGCKAIGTTEHGLHRGYIKKHFACKKAGIKLLIGVEMYLTESLSFTDEDGSEAKKRDNYHVVLIAKNKEGLVELNKLAYISTQPDHFYYNNRITFDEFLNISSNVIKISACLAGVLCRLDEKHKRYMELARAFDFYEIQPHANSQEQKDYNVRLMFLSEETGIPLIAGTDTHNSTPYQAECRAILMARKGQSYGDEDKFNLNWRTYDEIINEFQIQNALPESVCLKAIENTNVLADMCEEIEIDTKIKYPILYGSAEADADKFEELCERKFEEKLNKGIIPESQREGFRNALDEEYRVFRKLNMSGFMLSMAEILGWCKENNIARGTARGSVGGSRAAYISDIIDMNPEQWHTNFARFANEDRGNSIGDIDTDVCGEDRPKIFQHIIERFGSEKCARVSAYGTIQDLAFIDDVVGGLKNIWNKTHTSNEDNPYTLDYADEIKNLYKENADAAKEKYEDVFYYFDGMINTLISQSVHPAGMVIAPIELCEYGTFIKDGESCLLLDMDEAHEVGLAKYDLLILKNVQVIRDACRMLGIDYPKSSDMDFEDVNVWDDMIKSPVGIFEFESGFAFESLRRMKPRNIFEMSLVTAAIRPSGASYRDDLLDRKIHHNPSQMIDELLKDNLGYLVYQEDIIAFLKEICGLSGSTADTVRRGIAGKKKEILDANIENIYNGYCSRSDKISDVARDECSEFIQIIQDASSYMFGYNHSVAYCMLGYYCAYFRYYHTTQFIAASLNVFQDNMDKTANYIELAQQRNIPILPIKFGHSRAEYSVDVENNSIYKGIASIKYMNSVIADELIEVYNHHPKTFMDTLKLIKATSVNSRQINILIDLNFFSEYGNPRELKVIYNRFDFMKFGEMSTIKTDKIPNGSIGEIIKRYSTNINAKNMELKTYTILDMDSILRELESDALGLRLEDYTFKELAEIQKESLGYVDIMTGKKEDRRKLYILDIHPLRSKVDKQIWAYSFGCRSVGSGKTSNLTVYKAVYQDEPFQEGDVIYAEGVSKKKTKNGDYWYLDVYRIEV